MKFRGRVAALKCLALTAVAASAFISLSPTVASAAPENTTVSAYRLPCGKAVCEDASAKASMDDVVAGEIQLQASTSSTLGLRSVELQVHASGEWRCIKKWNTSARSGKWQWDLDTAAPIQNCSGNDITDGSNGAYRFRTLATDASTSDTSSTLILRVSNRPATPVWASEPTRVGSNKDAPVVSLKWFSNPEPDIVEYHFARTGPNGTFEYAVSATKPGGQGCSLQDNVYSCVDDDFPAQGFAGRYSYTLMAYRSSPDPSTTCSLPGTSGCIYSGAAENRSATLAAPPPSLEPTKKPTAPPAKKPKPKRPSATPVDTEPNLNDLVTGDFEFDTGTFNRSLPYAPVPGTFQEVPVAPDTEGTPLALDSDLAAASQSARQRRNLIAMAGGLLMLVLATHLGRVLKSHTPSGR